MASPKFDRPKAIKILVDAEAFGDTKACVRWKITKRTLQNYRKRLDSDPELSRAFAVIHQEADRSWKRSRRTFLEKALAKATTLAQDEKDLEKLSRAIERIGNLDVASEALNVGDRSHSESAPAPSDAGETGGGGSGASGSGEDQAGEQTGPILQ